MNLRKVIETVEMLGVASVIIPLAVCAVIAQTLATVFVPTTRRDTCSWI